VAPRVARLTRPVSDTGRRASATFYGAIRRRTLIHAGDPLLSLQIPRTVRKNIGDNYRISRPDSSIEIDCVIAVFRRVFRVTDG
jgi:hypothetical protein